MMRVYALVCLLILAGCSSIACVVGSGESASITKEFEKFEHVFVQGPADVTISQDSANTVEISGYQNILDVLHITSEDGTVSIAREKFYQCYSASPRIQVRIHIEDLSSVHLAGAGDMVIDDVQTNELSLRISGSGDIDAAVDVNKLETAISGAGDASLHGSAKAHVITIGGSGVVHAEDLETQKTIVNIGGSGDAVVAAIDTLQVRIGGSGSVRYKHDPKISEMIAGAGSVSKLDE